MANKKSNKKVLIIAASIGIVAVILLTIFLLKDKSSFSKEKTKEYYTEECNIVMPTAKEGETEIITNETGDELVVGPDGVYKKSSYGDKDSYEKLMNQKIVPLVGRWRLQDSERIYEFYPDMTVKTSFDYLAEDGTTHQIVYTGKVTIKNSGGAVSYFHYKNTAEMYKEMEIDTNTFVDENLYFVDIKYDTYYTTEDTTPRPLKTEEDGEAVDALGDSYLFYTYWIEDLNEYKMKMCSLQDIDVLTFVRENTDTN